MIVIGGIGLVVGPIFGALVFLILEELLKGWTTHWMLVMGPIIVLIALAGRNQFSWLKAFFNRPRAAQAVIKAQPAGETR